MYNNVALYRAFHFLNLHDTFCNLIFHMSPIRTCYWHGGLPMEIVSNRDPKFTSDFWTQVFKKLETTLSMSSMNHPQSDGQTNY